MIVYYLITHPQTQVSRMEAIDEQDEDHDDRVLALVDSGWIIQKTVVLTLEQDVSDEDRRATEEFVRQLIEEVSDLDEDFPDYDDEEDWFLPDYPVDEYAYELALIYTGEYIN